MKTGAATIQKQKLSKTNKMATCRGCGKRTHSSIQGDVGIGLCRACYEDAGDENEHSDNHSKDEPVAGCRFCVQPEPKAALPGEHVLDGTDWDRDHA